MAVKPIPDEASVITPYLTVKGVDKLIEFLQKAFGATLDCRFDMPDGTVMHAQMRINGAPVMMGEAGGPWEPMPGNIHMYVENADELYRRALEAGATSVREPRNEFYGDRSAGVKDMCGNMWWLATHVEDVSREEMEQRMKAARPA